ncbi:hypothetical protein GJ744_012311 [Endocarpon pusillum]|uniref:Uncharacterized protein n=1 Tax=Endocarpon pusillum TaxID=364733 RepID=A0A8H7E0G9_9EURO|nr:hypothetical protein GJ744_012311 [Endocarpon pusillum]
MTRISSGKPPCVLQVYIPMVLECSSPKLRRGVTAVVGQSVDDELLHNVEHGGLPPARTRFSKNMADALEESPSSSQSSMIQSDKSKIVAVEYVQLYEDPNPHLEVRCIVRNALTGEDIRHAVAEFWLEGNDMLGGLRRLWCVRIVNDNTSQPIEDEVDQIDGTSLQFSYTAAVVSGVDDIPEEWPVEVKDSVARLAVYREDGSAIISLTKLVGGSRQSVLKYLKDCKPGNLWKPYMDEEPQVT